ncbi:MAG: RNA methyltransferase [Bacteroidetes bacterium]|nr:RNA methyltransferase [Bacteroidota bacterium]MCL1968482.1 RNA methyltransferase [Bacteroidota bacterium]
MIPKALIAQIRLLHHKKHRDEQGVFIVEGIKSCTETLQSHFEVTHCFVTERFKTQEAQDAKQLCNICENPLQLCNKNNGETSSSIIYISQKEMERISCLTTAPEILCVVKKIAYSLNDLNDEKPLLVLDAIRDPGNLGTIIRTADWFGFDQILCSEDCVELTNPKVIQATMGSFIRTKIVYANLSEYLQKQTHRTIYGLYMNGEPIQKQSFKQNDIVIIGSESHGISEAVAAYITKKIEISLYPNRDTAPESLNAAIAAGILMYEFR